MPQAEHWVFPKTSKSAPNASACAPSFESCAPEKGGVIIRTEAEGATSKPCAAKWRI